MWMRVRLMRKSPGPVPREPRTQPKTEEYIAVSDFSEPLQSRMLDLRPVSASLGPTFSHNLYPINQWE